MTPKENSDQTLGRREVFRLGTKGALALAGLGLMETGITKSGIAFAQGAPPVTTPASEEGPFFVEEMLNRTDIRVDPSNNTVQPGLPLRLTVNVSRLNGGKHIPMVGAKVDLWHASGLGLYSDEASEQTLGKKYLRGYQITNAHGIAQFVTVYPGWYGGRTAHIHARVRTYAGTTKTHDFETQFFFDDAITSHIYSTVAPYNTRPNRDTTNANDHVYNGASTDGQVASKTGQYLLFRLANDNSHAIASFNVLLNW